MKPKSKQNKAREMWFIEQKKADLFHRLKNAEKFGPLQEANRLQKQYDDLLQKIEEGSVYGS